VQLHLDAEAPPGALDRDLDVPTLARHAGFSERSFYRKFTDATGKTAHPA